MEIKKTVNGEMLTVALSGRLDTTTAPELEKEMNTGLVGVKKLVLDFSGLSYVSSAGLRVILKAQKTMNANGSMKLKHVNKDIMEVFEITGFVDILTIE